LGEANGGLFDSLQKSTIKDSAMAIAFRYKPVKARQLAAGFLRPAPGFAMSYIKLIKLMYLADRKRLLACGSIISGDRFFSLPHGPVLSNVMDCIRGRVRDQDWMEHFKTQGYDIRMIADPGDDELCRFDEEIIQQLHSQFRDYDWQGMVGYCHANLPEWRDPGRSSSPIDYTDVLTLAGKSGAEIRAIEEQAAESLSIDYCLDLEDASLV
jgi:uncharacterized phage-associated protein